MKSVDELRELVSLKQRLTHRMNVDDVLSEYQLPDKAECSYGHPHNEGVVVLTRCGIRMALGLDCASKYVENFERVNARLDERKAHIFFLKTLQKRLDTLANQLAEAEQIEDEVVDQVRSVRGVFPDLADALTEFEWNTTSSMYPWKRILRGHSSARALRSRTAGLAETVREMGHRPTIRMADQVKDQLMQIEEAAVDEVGCANRALNMLYQGPFTMAIEVCFRALEREFSTAAARDRSIEQPALLRSKYFVSDRGVFRADGKLAAIRWRG